MLNDIQRDTIIALLQSDQSFKINPRMWLLTRITHNAFANALDVHLGGVEAHALRAIAICEAARWDNDPPWLVLLLKAFAIHEGIQEIIDNLKVPPPAAPNPFTACVLHGELPFLDRASLRQKVQNLANTLDRCILVVNGKGICGKSYTARYLDYLSYSTSGFGVSRVKEDGNGAHLSPTQLAKDIVAGMDRPTTNMPDERQSPSIDRWVKELCTWILSEAAQTGGKWWIVLDGFRSSKLKVEGTAELIQHLADRISRGEARKRLRLILLEYPETFPQELRPSVEFETIASTRHIGELDLQEYFTCLLKSRKRNFEPTAVIEATKKVLENTPSESNAWLTDLAAQISEVSNAL